MKNPISWQGVKVEWQEKYNQYWQTITPDIFAQKIEKFIASTTQLLKQGRWYDQRRPKNDFLNADLSRFYEHEGQDRHELYTVFSQKIAVKPGAKIAVIADIHGDISALISVLVELHEAGYLDADFTIIADDFYIVFLGDYVNRVRQSVLVMTVLFDLVARNPGRVMLCRGNHEDAHTCAGFVKHLRRQQDAGRFEGHISLLDELSGFMSDYTYPHFLHWFEYLPHAVFIGSKQVDCSRKNYAMFAHGGLELGWNPNNFLADEQSDFELLTSCDRLRGLQKLVHEKTYNHIQTEAQAIFDQHKQFDLIGQQGLVSFEQPQSFYAVRLGTSWNNFLTEQFDNELATISRTRKSLYWGKRMTQQWFEQASSESALLQSIVRGHQHLDEHFEQFNMISNMRERIIAGHGCVRQWGGMVYTLGCAEHIANVHSFAMITIGESKNDWAIRHYFKQPDDECWSMRIRSLCD